MTSCRSRPPSAGNSAAAPPTDESLQADVALVAALPALPAILRLIREQADMRFVAVARVTAARWICCAVLDDTGLGMQPGDELPIEETLCALHLAGEKTIAFDDARRSPRFSLSSVPDRYGFRSYIAVPISRADGSHFGSLFALDPEPRPITQPSLVGMVNGLAGLMSLQLHEAWAHGATRQALSDERAVSSSREEFIAVVAHDLRNPLTTIQAASEILLRSPDPVSARLGDRLRNSAGRMAGLIDDLVDFARGRAGASMPVRLAVEHDLGPALRDVVDEMRDSHPEREIHTAIDIHQPVRSDVGRLQQLLSNLLGNAIRYGAADRPIVVEASVHDGDARIVVTNWGPPIDPARLSHVFDAYWQADRQQTNRSMGLGLHICRLIAEAHGGALTVRSEAELGTRFELRWPAAAAPLPAATAATAAAAVDTP